MTLTYPQELPKSGNTVQIYKTHDLLGPLLTQIWRITHLALHLTPRVTCWDFHIWGKLTDISYTLNRVPTSMHTLPSHQHLGNHPEDLFPSITQPDRYSTSCAHQMAVLMNTMENKATPLPQWIRDKIADIWQVSFSSIYGLIDNKPTWVLRKTPNRTGEKRLSQHSLLKHICVTRRQWVNGIRARVWLFHY